MMTRVHSPSAHTQPDSAKTVAHHKGFVLEVSDLDYLDGIQSGLTIRGSSGAPVAYAFDEAEARLMAAAPALRDALGEFYVFMVEGEDRVWLKIRDITIATARHDSALGCALLALGNKQQAALVAAQSPTEQAGHEEPCFECGSTERIGTAYRLAAPAQSTREGGAS